MPADSVGDNATHRSVVDDREIHGIVHRDRGAGLAVGAVTTGAIFAVQRSEVGHVGRTQRKIGLGGTAGKRIASSEQDCRSDAIAKSDFRLRAFNLMLFLALSTRPGASMPVRTANGEMLQRMDALGQVDHETRDGAERDLAQDEPSPLDARVEQRIDHAQRRP